eukprot:4340121-Karenia_brevis.AAC.1
MTVWRALVEKPPLSTSCGPAGRRSFLPRAACYSLGIHGAHDGHYAGCVALWFDSPGGCP